MKNINEEKEKKVEEEFKDSNILKTTPQKINILNLMVATESANRCNIYELIALTCGFQSLFQTKSLREMKKDRIIEWQICKKFTLKLYQYGRVSGTGIGVLIFPESCPSLAVFEGEFYDFEPMHGKFQGQGNIISFLNSFHYFDSNFYYMKNFEYINKFIGCSNLNTNGHYLITKKLDGKDEIIWFNKINGCGKGKIFHFEKEFTKFIIKRNSEDIIKFLSMVADDFVDKSILIISYDFTQNIKMTFELQNKDKSNILIFDIFNEILNKIELKKNKFFICLSLIIEYLLSECISLNKIKVKFDYFPAEIYISIVKIIEIVKQKIQKKSFKTFKIMIEDEIYCFWSKNKKEINFKIQQKLKFDDLINSNIDLNLILQFDFQHIKKLILSKNKYINDDYIEIILMESTNIKIYH